MNGNYYPTDDDRRAIADALKEHDQPLTIKAIEQNPWHAVARELPKDASAELTAEVVRVTDDLHHQATMWGNRAGVGAPNENSEEREHWFGLAELAQERGGGAALAHDRETLRAAWQ